jgi:toxin ParE1/3/4
VTRRAAFTPRATADIETAFNWYEQQRDGLGGEFETAVRQALDLVENMPELGPIVQQDVRRVLISRFPYAVYYRVTDAAIEIRACLHQRRSPRVWRRRL